MTKKQIKDIVKEMGYAFNSIAPISKGTKILYFDVAGDRTLSCDIKGMYESEIISVIIKVVNKSLCSRFDMLTNELKLIVEDLSKLKGVEL